jgi:TusE/DsrC/DsvC family sulfur relay protein
MADILKYIVDEDLIDTDPNGYLLRLEDWSEDIARTLAKDEGITLSEDHWEIVRFLRNYYSQFGIAPNVRTLRKALASEYGEQKSSKKYLYDLFPKGPSRQGCRIAGLPLPNDCVDWHG